MNECENIKARIDFYIDDELRGADLADFCAHLERCATCRAIVHSERRLVKNIREAGPLYQAPDRLRERVARILETAPRISGSESRWRVRPILGRAASAVLGSTGLRPSITLAVMSAILILAAGLWYGTGRRVNRIRPPSSFAIMAVQTHLRHLRGKLPFEITSDSPEQISRWFAGKVPFGLELPNYQESSGQDRLYRLEGARLVGLDNDYAAYVGYRMGDRKLSLVATSEAVATPAGGEEIISKGLTFHYSTLDGLKVITWSHRGLTYALVSDFEERGQQSCIVCHEGTKDRDFIEGFKPRP